MNDRTDERLDRLEQDIRKIARNTTVLMWLAVIGVAIPLLMMLLTFGAAVGLRGEAPEVDVERIERNL